MEAGDVDLDVGRNVAGQALDLELARDELEQAALGLDADGRAHQLDGDRDVHLLVHLDALEVEMDDHPAHRVPLQVAEDGMAFLAAVGELEQEDGILAVRLLHQLDEALAVELDRHRVLARAVHHTGDHAFAAGLAAAALARPLPLLDLDRHFAHGWVVLTSFFCVRFYTNRELTELFS